MKKSSYKELLEEIDYLLNLAKSLGIEPSEHSWIVTARDLISDLNSKLGTPEANKLLEKKEDNWKYFISIVQLSEVGNSVKFLSQLDPEIAKEKIKKIFKGSLLPQDETTSSNNSRNTLFEVTLAADFFNRGAKVEVTKDLEDVIIYAGGKEYIFECKRPFTQNSLERNIFAAETQLGNRLSRSSGVGIIVVSVTRILTDGGLKYLDTHDVQGVEDALYGSLSEFITKNERIIARIKNKRIGAIAFQVSCPANVVGDAIPTWARYIVIKELGDGYKEQIEKDLVGITRAKIGQDP